MSERKVTECFVESSFRTLAPTLAGGYEQEYEYQRPAVILWRLDYDALLKELAEYKALIKVCDRCEKKDFHEFVRCGSLGLDYCESCFDEMGEK